MTENSESNKEPNVDPEDLPDDGGVEVEKGVGSIGDNPDTTSSSQTRWTYIATLLAGVAVTSLPILVLGASAGLLSLTIVTQGWFVLYSTIVLMAATWTFGEETLKAVQRAKSGK